MLTFIQAKEIAETTIRRHSRALEDQLIIVDAKVIEKPYAWIFPYTSKRWIENEGDIQYALGGNSPIFVSKQDGQVSTFRSGLSIEGMIEAFEEENKSWSLKIPIETYSDVTKLLALKKSLNRTQEETMELKSSKCETVDTGARSRLLKLAELLRASGISCNLELTIQNE